MCSSDLEPADKRRYVEQLEALETSGPRVFINGKVPVSLVEMLNPRNPGSADQ